MEPPLRLALVGHGAWGKNIERTLKEIPNVLLSIVERGTSATDVDGVIIATPASTHAASALPYIERGIPVFIEKPITTSIEDVERLADAAHKSGGLVFVGHLYFYHPAFQKALSLLSDVGPIVRVDAEGANNKVRSDTTVLWDWLPHYLAMGYEIFGRWPDSVAARALAPHQLITNARVEFSFDGVPFVSTISWTSHEKRQRVVITGEKGTITFDGTSDRGVMLERGGTQEYPLYSEVEPLRQEIEAFIATVREGVSDRPHLAEGAAIVSAIVATETSLTHGGKVSIGYSA